MKGRSYLYSVLLVMAILACQKGPDMIGQAAPDFTLIDLNGDTVTLSRLNGQFVVIHMAASW